MTWVHAQLESSVPAAGDTLATSPTELVLGFSGLVEETAASLQLLGPGGRSWSLEPTRDATDPRIITAELPELERGGFRLEWRVVSADGHPISGDFVFFVAGAGQAGGEGDRAMEPPPPSTRTVSGEAGDHAGGPSATGAEHVDPIAMGTRSGADLALLALGGLLLFAAWGPGDNMSSTTSTIRVLSITAPVLATAYAWVWVGGVLGAGASVDARIDGLLSFASGRALTAEGTFAWLAVWALFLARRPKVASVLALAAVSAGAWGGHPVSYTPSLSVPSNALHLLAAAAWTGGLLFLVTEKDSPQYEASAQRVSQLALTAVVAIAATGVLQTWLILDTFGQLLGSTYGLLVLAKTAGLAGLVAFGAYHRFKMLPTIRVDGDGARLAVSVRKQLTLAAALVVIAAVLSHVPPTL